MKYQKVLETNTYVGYEPYGISGSSFDQLHKMTSISVFYHESFSVMLLYVVVAKSAFFLSSSLSFKCALRESGCRIGYEPTKMSRVHFWRSISRDINLEVSALSPPKVLRQRDKNQIFSRFLTRSRCITYKYSKEL